MILSAQATDVSVNKITPALFEKFPTPRAFVEAPLEEIENSIRTIGLFRNKAKHIKGSLRNVNPRFQWGSPSNYSRS